MFVDIEAYYNWTIVNSKNLTDSIEISGSFNYTFVNTETNVTLWWEFNMFSYSGPIQNMSASSDATGI